MPDTSNPRAVIGDNQPPPHAPFLIEAEDLRTESSNWLDGNDIQSDADADGVAQLINMASDLEKRAEAARVVLTKPLDERKKAIMDDFRPVGTACDLIKSVGKKAMTKWLQKKEAERQEAARIERERLDAERARIEAEMRAAKGIEAAEAIQQAAAEHIAAEKALLRAEKDTAKVTGAGRTIAMRTAYDIEVTDAKAMAAWFWTNCRGALVAWMTDEARKQVRACQGNTTIDGVKIITEKVAV
jgi:hypothetical protein